MGLLKKYFTIMYFKAMMFFDKLDINHIISYAIAFIGGAATTYFVLEDKIIWSVVIAVVSALLNELFRFLFKSEPDMVIVAQSDNVTDEEFMNQISSTIENSIRGNADEENRND